MRILVTGGCGYIGSATARRLRAAGHSVLVVDDLSTGHREAWDGETKVIDLCDGAVVRSLAAAEGFDGVIHFAAKAYVGESVEQPLAYWRANLLPVLHLCEAFPGVPFVFSSSCTVYGQPQTETLSEDHPVLPISPYGNTKAAAERLLADRAAAGQGSYAALRYFNAAGAEPDGAHGEDHRPEPHLIPRAILAALGRGEALPIMGTDYETHDGTCVRDYVHIADLADAHLLALDRMAGGKQGGAWNLGTGRGASVRDVVSAVEAAVGASVPVLESARRPGDAPRMVADSKRARRELGWSPAWTDLGELVETAVRWHREHPDGYPAACPSSAAD